MKKGYIFILITAFLYSTQEISGRFLVMRTKMDALQIVFWVFMIGFIFFIPFMLQDMKKKKLQLRANDFMYFFITGTLCIPLSLVLLQTAVYYTKASVVAIIISGNAVFTLPFAYFILKEKIKTSMVVSLVLTLVGVIIIMNPLSLVSGIADQRNLIGLGFAIGGAVAFSLYSVVTAKRLHYYGGYISNCFSFMCGLIVLLIVMLLLDKPFIQGINFDGLMILLYMGIFIKALGYLFYLESIKLTSAVTASVIFMIKPALATVLAFFLLNEAFSWNVLVGICFIVIGSYIGYYFKKKELLVTISN